MADNKGVGLSITAKDNTSSVVERIKKSLGGLGSTAEKATKPIGASAVVDQFAKLSSGARDYTRHIREAVMETTKLVPPLAALGGIASLAGIGSLAQQFGKFGTNLQTSSARAVVSVKRLQQLQDAVQLGGGDREGVAGGLASLHDAATGALTGMNSDAALAFQYMHIGDADLKGPTDALFEKVRAKLAQFQKIDPMFAEMMGSKVFGGGFASMAPAILRPDATWAGYEKKAAEINPGVTEDGAKQADHLRETFDQIDIRVHAIGHTIAAELAPPMASLVDSFGKFMGANQEAIGRGARELADFLQKMDWKGMAKDTEVFAGKIDGVVKQLGGWKVAVELLGAAWLLNSPVGKLTKELALLAAFKVPMWMGRLLGIGAAGGLALESTLLLGGDTPSDTPHPDAISREDAQRRVDEISKRLANGPGFFTRLWHGFTGQDNASPLPKGEQDTRAQKAFDYFVGKGWSPKAAAGIVAGGVTESGLDEKRPGDGGAAYGVFQWHADRQEHFRQLFGHDIRGSTLEEQYAFKDAELRGRGGDGQSAQAGQMMNLPNVSAGQAGAIDSLYAERPGDTAGEARRRHNLAEQLYQKYAPAVPTVGAINGNPAGGAGPNQKYAPAVPTVGANDGNPTGGAGPSGNARIDVHVSSDGRATATVRQQGDNYSVAPAMPSRMPMNTTQGG